MTTVLRAGRLAVKGIHKRLVTSALAMDVNKQVDSAINGENNCGISSKSGSGQTKKWDLPSVLPSSERLVWVDCEMSGLNLETEVLLEVAMIITEGDTLSVLAKTDNIIIHVEDKILNNMDEWNTRQHGESGLTQACRDSKISLEEAEQNLLKVLKAHTPRGKCPLAGNTISADRKFLEKYMPELHSHLHYRNVDVSSIKELARRWFPSQYERLPRKKCAHRALDDIEESIKELQYYREAIFRT